MKNVIAIIKNAWGDSPPPKVKTGFILNIIGLTAFLCLSGATAHAQSDKQIINMDNPDYHIDVERFCSPFIDFDNPEEYNSKEVNYRYVKYTQNMNVSFSERYPILIHYISMDSLVTKKATFCDTGFGKLNLITNAQGKLISMNCETKMDKTGFKELVKAVRQKYGKPALKKAETGKDELKKILINSMVSKGKNIPVYLWKQDDEYIGLFMESEDVVNFFRAKKEFEDLFRDDFIVLGGGSGFFAKNLIYPFYAPNHAKAVKTVSQSMQQKHKHEKDIEYGISPHTFKITEFDRFAYPIGLCQVTIQ